MGRYRSKWAKFDLLGTLLAALAFFAVGMIWYGALFGQPWRREAGVGEAPEGLRAVRIIVLTFLCELLIVLMLAHNIARTNPPPHVIMMMAVGFALAIMAPAIAINYLHQRKSATLFLIDAGHLVVGMSAAGAVLIVLR